MAVAGFIALLAFCVNAAAGPNDVAIIIANKDYQRGVRPVDFAHRNGEPFKRIATVIFQVPERNIIELYRARLLDGRAIDVLAEFDTSERKRYEIFIDPGSGRMKMQCYLGKLSRDDVHRIMLHLASHAISHYLASGEKADPSRRCDIGPVS